MTPMPGGSTSCSPGVSTVHREPARQACGRVWPARQARGRVGPASGLWVGQDVRPAFLAGVQERPDADRELPGAGPLGGDRGKRGHLRPVPRDRHQACRSAVGGQPRWRYVMRRRRRRGHGVPVTLLVLLLGVLAVIAAVAWMVEHLMVFAGCALLIGSAFYLGQLHEHRRARPAISSRPGQARPEEPAAATALRVATLPLAGYGQDEELTDEQPARRADRTQLLADPLSGVRPPGEPAGTAGPPADQVIGEQQDGCPGDGGEPGGQVEEPLQGVDVKQPGGDPAAGQRPGDADHAGKDEAP